MESYRPYVVQRVQVSTKLGGLSDCVCGGVTSSSLVGRIADYSLRFIAMHLASVSIVGSPRPCPAATWFLGYTVWIHLLPQMIDCTRERAAGQARGSAFSAGDGSSKVSLTRMWWGDEPECSTVEMTRHGYSFGEQANQMGAPRRLYPLNAECTLVHVYVTEMSNDWID